MFGFQYMDNETLSEVTDFNSSSNHQRLPALDRRRPVPPHALPPNVRLNSQRPTFHKHPSGQPQIRDYNAMLAILDLIIYRAPTFNKRKLRIDSPIACMFGWPMGISARNSVFHDPKVNAR